MDAPTEAERLQTLTQREREILSSLALGHTVTEVAEHSNKAVSTVRTQVRSILRKLGVRTQLQAILLAQRVAAVRD